MEGFAVICLLGFFIGLGAVMGTLSTTNDVTQKEILEANKVCESGGGVYKINKGMKKAIAFCKDNNTFVLKGDK